MNALLLEHLFTPVVHGLEPATRARPSRFDFHHPFVTSDKGAQRNQILLTRSAVPGNNARPIVTASCGLVSYAHLR